MMQDLLRKLNPGLPWKKNSQQEEDLFLPGNGAKIYGRNYLSATFGAQFCVELKFGHFGN
jgi:hypothetical protein